MIDTSINLGNLITIVTVLGGLVAMFATMRSNVADLKEEVKKLAEVLITVARQDERLNAMDNRLGAQGKRLDEMRATLSRVEGGRFEQLCDQVNQLIVSQAAHSPGR